MLKCNIKKRIKFLLGFSLVELSISFIVISILLAAFSPVISKKLAASSSPTSITKLSMDCKTVLPEAEGYCTMCYESPKRCILCSRTCAEGEYKDTANCVCLSCQDQYGDSHCTKCDESGCKLCDNGYFFGSDKKCTACPKGSYCYQNDNESVKKTCSAGY